MTVNAIYGIPAEVIADICRVDASTARRWKSGSRRIPYAAQALVSGDLGAFSKSWEGWRVQGDSLLSPDGWKISRQDALTVPLLQAQLSAVRAELERLKACSGLEVQPPPDEELPAIR